MEKKVFLRFSFPGILSFPSVYLILIVYAQGFFPFSLFFPKRREFKYQANGKQMGCPTYVYRLSAHD